MVVAQSEVFLRSAVTDDDLALEGEMRIGREKDCEIRVDDIHISRYHARITVADGQILLEDLGSTNGTYVNGARIHGPQSVSIGDELRFHHCLFRLVSNQASDLDRTVFGWPVNPAISPPSTLPEVAAPISMPVALDLGDDDVDLPYDFEPEALEEHDPEIVLDRPRKDKKSAIARQIRNQDLETESFIQRVFELPIGVWLVLNDQQGDAYVVCKFATRSTDTETLRFISETGFYMFEKGSRELAADLQYDRARVLEKGPLMGRIAVLLTRAMSRARKAQEQDDGAAAAAG
jgi:hypothetical protein